MTVMEIEKTADGSYTLFVPELDEHYHSVKGALTESEHIFINMGLKHSSAPSPRILEIGFGTGLNAFLTSLEAKKDNRSIFYTTIEKYPLDMETIKLLDYPELIAPEESELFYSIHNAGWNSPQTISGNFTIEKIEGDFTEYRFRNGYDIIYFDAFAPEKQPEMWNQTLFNNLYEVLNDDGILTTYCAKGAVRRMLQEAGFIVERLPGPPGGKREILRGTKKATDK